MKEYEVQWHKYNMEQMDLFSTTFYSSNFEGINHYSPKGNLFFCSSTSKHSRTH